MIGRKLAHYSVSEKIGEGGMGEVWKAQDTVLGREVAIKILPEIFVQDAERRARFEREARILAQLNHPGIAAVYGLHSEGDTYFLAMELVPGEDLSHRLARGALGVDEALKVGVRVAEALEAAHEQGVIHRDLKPSNILLMPGGAAKVLDFGLAKSVEVRPASDPDISHSPTMTTPAGTMAGVILGTAAYMSPEQARGRTLDKRTDIWSFGCVLYECLTGTSLFRGETVSDSIGAILHKDPDWDALPPETPATVRLLLQRCLTRDPDRRLRDIGDARLELEQALQDPSGSYLGVAPSPEGARARRSSRRGLALGALVGLVGIALGVMIPPLLRSGPEPPPLRKLDLGMEIVPEGGAEHMARVAPDGSKVVVMSRGKLWVQFLDELEPRELEGTEGALGPFWSPDGEDLAFFQDTRIRRIAASGGRATTVAELGQATAGGYGGTWGEDGRIVFSRGNTGLLSVPAVGGEPRELVPLQEGDGDIHEPHLLPDGAGLVCVLHPASSAPNVLMAVRDGERQELLRGEPGERFLHPVYDERGFVLFRRSRGSATAGIWALPFDADRLRPSGEAFLVAPDAASPSLSREGSLVFISNPSTAGRERQMVWVDPQGRTLEEVGEPKDYVDQFSLSPDGTVVAFDLMGADGRRSDLWVRDLARGTERPLTQDEHWEMGYTWMPDGESILFTRFLPGFTAGQVRFHRVPADGSAAAVELGPGFVSAVTRDGRTALVTVPAVPDSVVLSLETPREIRRVDLLDPGPGERFLQVVEDRVEEPELSPDETLVAYEAVVSGRPEIFLARYPEGTGRWQVSTGGGIGVSWSPDGDRLYYVQDRMLMGVAVDRTDGLTLGRPEPLFELQGNTDGYSVSPRGDRFLVLTAPASRGEETGTERISVKHVSDWLVEFR